jgi:hypothetical protein
MQGKAGCRAITKSRHYQKGWRQDRGHHPVCTNFGDPKPLLFQLRIIQASGKIGNLNVAP